MSIQQAVSNRELFSITKPIIYYRVSSTKVARREMGIFGARHFFNSYICPMGKHMRSVVATKDRLLPIKQGSKPRRLS